MEDSERPTIAGAAQATDGAIPAAASAAATADVAMPATAAPPSEPPDPGAPDLRVGAPTPRVALVVIAAVALVAVLYAGREVLAPFVLGIFLVFLLDPPVEWLARRGIGRTGAVLLVYLAVIAIVVALVAITAAPLVAQIRKLIDELPTLIETVRTQLIALLERLGVPADVVAAVRDALEHLDQTLGGLDPGVVLPFLTSIFSFVGSVVAFLIVPVWVFYVVRDRPSVTAGLEAGIPEGWRGEVRAVTAITTNVLGRWVRGQLVLGSTVGLATLAGLVVLGIFVDPIFLRFSIILAVLAGFMELLPIIGPIISAVPAVILGATVSPVALLAVFLLYLGIQQLENTFLVPKIQGDAVQLHPAAVLFVIVLGGAVYGLLGAILAVPIAAAARDVYRYFFRRLSDHRSDLTRAIARPPADPPPAETP